MDSDRFSLSIIKGYFFTSYCFAAKGIPSFRIMVGNLYFTQEIKTIKAFTVE
jgi:hypothetical protein